MTHNDKVSHTQMRTLRLRYDELNRETGKLVLKTDMEFYIDRLRRMVERALKNSGFDKQPIYVDRRMGRKAPASQIRNKGKVLRR